jgi:endogenous inhibitor of DNA gyrase (YacG/DUF329 family)
MTILKVKCPTCKKNSAEKNKNKYWPFCTNRCKLIDLGAWANEDYKIETQESGRIEDEEL